MAVLNFWLLHFFFVVILINNTVSSSSSPSSCSQSDLQRCLLPLKPLLENPNFNKFGSSEADIDRACGPLDKNMKCIMDFAKRCIPSRQRNLLLGIFGGIQAFMTDICTPGSEFRNNMIKHSGCYDRTRPSQLQCYENTKAERNALESGYVSPLEKVQKSCCILITYEMCIRNVLTEQCGKEAADVMAQGMGKLTAPITAQCNKLKFDSSTCSSSESANMSSDQ